MLYELDHPTFVEVIEKPSNVGVKHIVHLLLQERVRQRIQRLMLAAPRAKPVGEAEKVLFVDLVEDGDHGMLDKFVFDCRDLRWTSPYRGCPCLHPSSRKPSASGLNNPD